MKESEREQDRGRVAQIETQKEKKSQEAKPPSSPPVCTRPGSRALDSALQADSWSLGVAPGQAWGPGAQASLYTLTLSPPPSGRPSPSTGRRHPPSSHPLAAALPRSLISVPGSVLTPPCTRMRPQGETYK